MPERARCEVLGLESRAMGESLDLAAAKAFAIACLIGALTGLEREKHRETQEGTASPGLRTFILVAEVGAVAGWLTKALDAPWIIAATLVAVAIAVMTGYAVAAYTKTGALGLTTEMATLVVCLLGAMTTLGYEPLAVGLAVVTAAVLAYKQSLHGLVDRLGWDDVYAGLRLLIAAFVVLPLLPDQPVDPWGALNPASLWRLVLLISGLSLVGYVATRWLGERRGTALTGITGGLVSSTAVTLSFARESAGRRRPAEALAGGILLAWAIMFGRVVVEVFVVNAALLRHVLPPFLAMGVVAAGFALWLIKKGGQSSDRGGESVPLRNPFSLTAAAKFAAFFAAVLVVVKLAQQYFPGTGLYVVAALAGLSDVDAITLSMAEQAKSGDPGVPVAAIVIAVTSNTLVKAGMAAALGSAALRRPILTASAAIVASGAVAAWLL
jgi:uncharacterized membrane protein (DUF4010 family)